MAHNCLICGHFSSQNFESPRSINLISKSSKIYTILYIQSTQLFKKFTQFYIFNIHNFMICGHFSSRITKSVRFVHSIFKPSKNVQNFVYSIYKFCKECI